MKWGDFRSRSVWIQPTEKSDVYLIEEACDCRVGISLRVGLEGIHSGVYARDMRTIHWNNTELQRNTAGQVFLRATMVRSARVGSPSLFLSLSSLQTALVESSEPTHDAFAKMVLVVSSSLFRRVDDRNFFP